MKVKDIVNRDIVNLDNCEQEPIHIPGSIQPHGFLLGLKEKNFIIDYCSANCAEYLGIQHTEVLGRDFKDLFGPEAETALVTYINEGRMLSSSLLRLNLQDKDYLCTLHNSNAIFVLEAEPIDAAEKNASQVYDQTSQFLNYMSDTHTLRELCNLVANGTRELTGYDRVMIYRFDEDYNGEVFAESRRDDLEPFLGLHYPHTDIPVQARQLYMQNLLRLIADVDYKPVPIYTVDDEPGKNLDLSLSILRSTSPIHVEYLHNMGVGATLTISLIYKKRLWGLIACHHYSPKNITPEVRLAAQLQGHFITSQIDMRQAIEEYDVARKTATALEAMNKVGLESSSGSFAGLIHHKELLELCNASGVAIVFNNNVFKTGITPDDDEIQKLAGWLAVYTSNGYMSTDKLTGLLQDDARLCSRASGIIYHSLHNDNNNCIIWFRPETKVEVNWAGDPSKSIVKDEKGLSPRKSFELWQEIVDCRSKEWLQPEITAAAAYSYNLQRHINLYTITREEEKYRKLSELLKETNSELENINWISTHDLQEPLRKIQLISSRILSKEEQMSQNVQDAILRMNNSANRMQTLLVDILKYTRLKHTDEMFEAVNLNHTLEEVKSDLAESINEKSAVIMADQLPEVSGNPFLLKQLFSNLIANSVKYSSPERPPIVKITSSHTPVGYTPDDQTLYNIIYVADNGMGFEQEYAESIFNIFTKLHISSDYKGSGVGLALCKKIMQTHKGYITATSELGVGTVISLYFPVPENI
jgi:chemotaxis family two-component system sensor kinase Cph1